MTMDVMFSSKPRPKQHFETTAELRRAVLSKGDEYSDYEQSIVWEINELRKDPVAYAAVVESEATVGYPYVRDDDSPADCSEMTLEQLRVYIADFQREREEVRESLRLLRGEWAEAEAAMRERWGLEDAERARRGRRSGCGGGRRPRHSNVREEDYAVDRVREAQELNDHYAQQVRNANMQVTHIERSCKWAIEGANIIIQCVHDLREAKPVLQLEYSRSLTLAARDVGNECHSVPTEKKSSPRVSIPTSIFPRMNTNGVGDGDDDGILRLPPEQSLLGKEQCSNTARSSVLPFPIQDDKVAGASSTTTSTTSQNKNYTSNAQNSGSTTVDHISQRRPNNVEQKITPLLDVYSCLGDNLAGRNSFLLDENSSECDQLVKATTKSCNKYGYYSGMIRGLQLCAAFPPRKMLIQMLLGSRVPKFTLRAPISTSEENDPSLFSQNKQLRNPLLWPDGRLLGSGWVRTTDGFVSVTVLIATSFEELNLIHERQDFTLPQLHRILNSPCAMESSAGYNRTTVVHIQSALGVKVIEPVSHPIYVYKEKQRLTRLLIRADPQLVEITAMVTSVNEGIPLVPVLDRELLLVQHSQDNIEEVEILIDIRAAWHRWSGNPFLIHLFERDKSSRLIGPFTNVGFVRVTPTQCVINNNPTDSKQLAFSLPAVEEETAISRMPRGLAHEQCNLPMKVKEETYGWPLVTVNFQECCATIIEPLEGTWIAYGEMKHIAIQVPDFPYLQTRIKNIRLLLEKEQSFFEWEMAIGSQKQMTDMIASTMEKLTEAEKELQENEGPLQQEIAQLQKSMVKKRGKELTRLKKHEEELQERYNDMKRNVDDLREVLLNVQEDLLHLSREYTLRAKRLKNLQEEYQRLCERADRTKPLVVEVVLVKEDSGLSPAVEKTRLPPSNSTCTVYRGDVRLTKGFKGCAVLLVNDLEAVRWEVRPGY